MKAEWSMLARRLLFRSSVTILAPSQSRPNSLDMVLSPFRDRSTVTPFRGCETNVRFFISDTHIRGARADYKRPGPSLPNFGSLKTSGFFTNRKSSRFAKL